MTRVVKRALAGAVILMYLVVGALAQQVTQWGHALDSNTRTSIRVQDGGYLDANPQVGSGGYNYRSGGGNRGGRQLPLQQARYEVMRSGTNRYNTPTVYGGGQRYRATRQYPRTDYHAPRQNRSPNRVDSSAYRVNTRLYP